MEKSLNWGILGAGAIAKAFAAGVNKSRHGKLLAVASREQAKADKFADEFSIPRRFASYDDLLADPAVEAVYIATPHPHHARWAIRAAAAKKHLLVEKPIGMNHPEAMAIAEAARANDVFLMEAFMYRCHPQTHKLVEVLRSGVLGQIRVISASFSFFTNFNPASRLYANELGGGGILDVGCYPVSMARLVAGIALGKDIAEPLEVKGMAHLGATGADEWAVATLKFPTGILAQVATGVAINQENAVRIFGTEGALHIPSPWVPSRDGGMTSLFLHKRGAEKPEEIKVDSPMQIYGIEADTVARFVDQRQAAFPAMSIADTLGNMKVLDLWRQSAGLLYEQERPQNIKPVHGGPLNRSRSAAMPYGQLPGVTKKISRLLLGADGYTFPPHVAVMGDDFIERGGNAFDTAHIYGGGSCEKALGAWIKSRNLRDDIVILGKGAHTPFCTPMDITRQLNETLERLQTDHLDIYMMHRDNTAIPVGEFVDILNEHISAGRIRAIGASNWTTSRIDEFNAAAQRMGKIPFAAISNNFSLARMVEAPWAGCLASSDPETRAWHLRTQMPLFSWSSQARGFFVEGLADPAKLDDKELVRCWYSDDNFKRLDRARQLAKKLGVRPINIALAYVLAQPFPSFALIGCRSLEELRTTFDALGVTLSPDDLKWLNLEM